MSGSDRIGLTSPHDLHRKQSPRRCSQSIPDGDLRRMILDPQNQTLVIAWLSVAFVLSPLSNAEETTRTKQAPKPVKLPGIVIDLQNGYVDLQGAIRVNNGYLELVACTKDTKEHESIVAVTARPMHIHTALLLLGANNGHPAMRKPVDEEMTRWINLPPRGDAVNVFLIFDNKEGKPVERPISDFLLYSKQRIDEVDGEVRVAPEAQGESDDEHAKRFPDTFLFTGSHLVDNGDGPRRYLADESGDVISIATFGDEVLSLPFHQTQANDALMWRANPKTLPEVGSEVTLRLRPKRKSDGSPNNRSTKTRSFNSE